MQSTKHKSEQRLSDYIVLTSSKWAYYRWIIGFIWLSLYTYSLFSMERISPGQRPVQLAFGFMFGLTTLTLLKLIDAYTRRIIIDEFFISTRFLFMPDEQFPLENITHIDCWGGGGKTIKYFFHQRLAQIELSVDSTTWKNMNQGIRLILQNANIPLLIEGQEISRIWFKRAISFALMILGVSFTLFNVFWFDLIGFVLVRLFWTQFLLDQKPYNSRALRIYLALFALATLMGLYLVAGNHTLEIAAWWIYSPAIDIAISYLVDKKRNIGRGSL